MEHMERPPHPGQRRREPTKSHSFRCTDRVWEKAKERAAEADVPMNYVIEQFIIGYSEGKLDLPRVVIDYGQTGETEAESKTETVST